MVKTQSPLSVAMNRTLISPLSLLLSLASVSPAADLLVGPPGSGAPYSSIQAAVDAALPGDRVLVGAGSYTGGIRISKPLELLGAGAGVTSSFSPSLPLIFGNDAVPGITVEDIAEGERVRISGLTVSVDESSPSVLIESLVVDQCAGVVELQALELPRLSGLSYSCGFAVGPVSIANCDQVLLSDVAITIPPDAPTPDLLGVNCGGNALWVHSSRVWIEGCSLRASNSSPDPGAGGSGLWAYDSSLIIGRSSVQGGNALGASAFGGAGITLVDSEATLHGGVGNQILGGDSLEPTGGPGAQVFGDSRLEWATDVVFQPGEQPGTFGAAVFEAGPGAEFVALGVALPSLSITPTHAPLGSSLVIRLEGEPGSLQLRALSLDLTHASPLEAVGGWLVVPASSALILPPVALDSTGSLDVPSSVPLESVLAGARVVEQCLQLAGGQLWLSPPAVVSFEF